MAQKFSKESVDGIYNNAKKVAYSEGFRDGHEKCKQDILNMIEGEGL